jgi:NAD(P)H-dependent flavin oxidoreductase YrpB (nitropropane dioxygenase family)
VKTALCDLLGVEYPIVGFTPSEHVAAAISRAGGFGVLGCVRFNDPAELDAALTWMDENTQGRPYGIDVVMPAKVPAEGTVTDLDALIPAGHKQFVERTLVELGVPPLAAAESEAGVLGWLHSVARQHVEVALTHPARLIANALGPPPADVIAAAHEKGMLVAALAGKAAHARAQVASGVDIVVAQGHEAGGHTGEIGTMVLVPEIVDAVSATGVPVLAAGGIGSGRQIAAALALGAVGVWMGSAWLVTEENVMTTSAPALRDALLDATSSDTVRSRIYSGKPARLLKNKWTQAWTEPGAPDPLPMPLQNILVGEAHRRLMNAGDPTVIPMPVGQIVGRLNEVRPVADVIADLVRDATLTLHHLGQLRD